MVNFVFLSVYFYSVPNLRFPSFSHDWKIYTFDDIASYKKGPFGSALKKDLFVSKSKESVKVYEQQNAINKDCHLERYFISANYYEKMKSFTVYPGDTIVSCAGTIGELYTLPENADIGIINQALMIIRNNQAIILKDFLNIQFSRMIDEFSKTYSNGSAIKNIPPFSDLKRKKTYVPDKLEQEKIIKFISLLDQKITTQIKIIDTLSSQKKQIRNLIFKDIHKNANCCIQDYVIYEQPQKYIVHSTDYVSHGKDYTPVLTANQSFILGYTLEKDGIYKKGDCIIFDDFTNENKYVDFPFKVKSSALKILQTKEGLMLKFFYEYLQFLNFESTDHKRHYLSEVAVTDISVPNLKEQTFLCKIFTSFDNKLKNEEALLEKYRLQKQFLLNNLFI